MKYRYQPKRPGFIKRSFTNLTAIAIILANTVGASLPFVLNSSRVAAAGTVTITGDTAASENQPGWLFNRDTSNATPIEFNTDSASIGTGSLYVEQLSNVGAKKFVGEYFTFADIADINSISYDFNIGSGGETSDANEFYLNVYANFDGSPSTKYYDCRYDVIPTTGIVGNFTTVNFDPTQSYPVTVASQPWNTPHPPSCPSVPADMGAGAEVRMFAINMGDTTASDAGLDGYFDNVVYNTASGTTTYDFEPAPKPVKNTDTNETFDTIQEAIDDSDTLDSHTIVASDGVYNENVSIDKEITLKSENGAASTSIAPASGRAIQLLGQISNLDDITLEGFTLEGLAGQITVQANSQANDGYDYTNLNYRDLIINANGGFGLGLFDVNGITIDNVIINDASNGIEAVGLAELDLKNSSVSGSSGVGLNVFTAGGYEINNDLSISNSDFNDNSTGVKLINTSDVEINGGTVIGGSYGVISDGSNTTIDGTSFQNIYPSNYSGFAVAGLGGTVPGGFGAGTHAANDLTVKNSTFTDIGRIGVLAKGDSSELTVENITYTGKGAVNGLDYAVEFGAGATGDVTDSTITNNLAVASSDGSTSAGILITNYYGNGTEANISENNFSNNTSAISIGYDTSDTSKVTANHNNITGNNNGVETSSALVDVDATENWWGDQSGPSGEGPGTGNSVDEHAAFEPWLCQPFQDGITLSSFGVCDNTAPTVNFDTPTPSEDEYVSGTITPHVLATDDYGMGSYYIRLWKGAFESGVANLVSNNCYSAPGAFLLGTSQDVTCPEIDTTTLDDGKYVLSAQFLDGHTTWGSALRTIYVDNTAPAVPTNLMWTPEGGSAMASGGNTNVQKGTLDWQDLDTSVDKYKYYFWTDIPGYFEGESNAWTTEGTTYITQSPTGGSIWTDFYDQEGTYYFCIKAIDALGNTSSCSDTFSVTYDNTAPDAPVHEYPADNAVINFNDFWFEWSDVSDAVSYETQYSQSPGVGVDGAFTNVDWAGDYQNIQPTESKAHSVGANGTWYWQVRTVDAAGNKSSWTTPWKLTIDLVAPDAFNVSPADGSVVNGASITQEWGSGASDVDYFIYESYHDSGGTILRWHEEISGTSKTATNVGEAEYWWRVKAVDIAGNEGAWSPLWKITVDNTSPVITTNLPFGAIVNGTITIEEYVADNNPDQFGLSIYEDDGTTLMLTNNTDTTVVNTITELPDGEYIAKFTAIDKAGNEAALDVWFTVDNSKPTALITSPASGDVLSGDLTVEGTASDAQTNITEVLYTVTEIDAIGGDYVASIVNGTASYNDSTDTFEFDVLGLTDGYYRLKIQAFDEAGNWKYHHIDVEIDNTAPVVTINSLSPSTNTTPSITGTIDDALANIFVAINGSVPQAATNNGDGTWSFAVLSPLTVDTHTVEAYATDQNGNTTAPAPTINFSVTAPPLGVSTGSPNSNTNSNSSSNNNSNGNTPTVNAFTASSTDSEVLAAETDEDGDTPTSNEDGSDVAADTDTSISNPGAETDEEDSSDNGMLDLWWLWLILLAILAGILYYLFRPKNNEA